MSLFLFGCLVLGLYDPETALNWSKKPRWKVNGVCLLLEFRQLPGYFGLLLILYIIALKKILLFAFHRNQIFKKERILGASRTWGGGIYSVCDNVDDLIPTSRGQR